MIFETHLSRYGQENDMFALLEEYFLCGYTVTLAASSWQNGSKIVESFGYKPIKEIPTDGVRRRIYEGIDNEHAKELICHKGLRTVVLSKS